MTSRFRLFFHGSCNVIKKGKKRREKKEFFCVEVMSFWHGARIACYIELTAVGAPRSARPLRALPPLVPARAAFSTHVRAPSDSPASSYVRARVHTRARAFRCVCGARPSPNFPNGMTRRIRRPPSIMTSSKKIAFDDDNAHH